MERATGQTMKYTILNTNHEFSNYTGLCNCGEVLLYKPKSIKDIKDNLYDLVLIGTTWNKLKYCMYKTEWLIDCDCLFAHYTDLV